MIGILVAANKEWAFIKEYYKDDIKELKTYVFGEYFEKAINGKAVLIFKCALLGLFDESFLNKSRHLACQTRRQCDNAFMKFV